MPKVKTLISNKDIKVYEEDRDRDFRVVNTFLDDTDEVLLWGSTASATMYAVHEPTAVAVAFKKGDYNATSRAILPNGPLPEPQSLANSLRTISDWLARNHSEIIG